MVAVDGSPNVASRSLRREASTWPGATVTAACRARTKPVAYTCDRAARRSTLTSVRTPTVTPARTSVLYHLNPDGQSAPNLGQSGRKSSP